jgi:cytoskeleton protein RodZ
MSNATSVNAASVNAASVNATSSDATGQAVEDSVVQEAQQSDVPDNMLSGAGGNPGVEQNLGVEQLSSPADSVVEIPDEVTFADEAATTAPESGNAVVPAAPRGSDILRLNFRGKSWAEVVDANGFQLAYGMFESRTLNFEGQAPFRIMLGDATQVDVTVNGTEVGLKPYIRWNKTANLSVGKARDSSD